MRFIIAVCAVLALPGNSMRRMLTRCTFAAAASSTLRTAPNSGSVNVSDKVRP